MKVKIKLIKDGKIPVKGEPNAMCWDCYAYNIKTNENNKIEVDLGFSLEPPKGYGVRLIPRSNLTKYWWVLNNSIGVGDEDYRGSYKAIFTPLLEPLALNIENKLNNNIIKETTCREHPFPYQIGDRVCQLELYKREDFEWELVEELNETQREGGFGSTGLK